MAFDRKAYNKEYQRAHRAEMNEARRKWAKAHPEEARKLNTESHRKWREKNRERYNAYMREWQAKKKALAEKESK